jgi:light-regulated signal transduction histidine kinase (bacteriophytochrome)
VNPEVEGPEKLGYPELMSLAVHELRTPASVVGGYLRMVLKDVETPLSDRQRKMIEEAEKSCARLVALIEELSNVSKLDSGRIKLASQPLDVFPLVNDVAEHVQEGRDRGVHLKVRGAATGGRLLGDAIWLRTAFQAIFRAILREKSGPTTVVADRRLLDREGVTSAVIVVANEASVQSAYDGSAIVFDEKRGGLGLLVPLARRVIEGHGGQLGAAAAEGSYVAAKGTAVISLPITE